MTSPTPGDEPQDPTRETPDAELEPRTAAENGRCRPPARCELNASGRPSPNESPADPDATQTTRSSQRQEDPTTTPPDTSDGSQEHGRGPTDATTPEEQCTNDARTPCPPREAEPRPTTPGCRKTPAEPEANPNPARNPRAADPDEQAATTGPTTTPDPEEPSEPTTRTARRGRCANRHARKDRDPTPTATTPPDTAPPEATPPSTTATSEGQLAHKTSTRNSRPVSTVIGC